MAVDLVIAIETRETAWSSARPIRMAQGRLVGRSGCGTLRTATLVPCSHGVPHTGEPAWETVKTGLFGLKSSFVPIRDAEAIGDKEIRVPVQKEQVKDAPKLDPDGPETAAMPRTTCRSGSGYACAGSS